MRIDGFSERVWRQWVLMFAAMALLGALLDVALVGLAQRGHSNAIQVIAQNQKRMLRQDRQMARALTRWATITTDLQAAVRKVEAEERALQSRAKHLDAQIRALNLFIKSVRPTDPKR